MSQTKHFVVVLEMQPDTMMMYMTCTGQSEAIFKRIRELSQETGVSVYTFAEDIAASGGYWILSSGDKVFSQYATSLVGSIGVISSSFGVKQLTSSWGIERRVFTAGKAKMGMDPFSDVTEDQEERLRSVLEDMHESFIRSVKEARGDALDMSCADELFSGRVFTGKQAVQVGLCDGVGTVSSVMKEMFGQNVRLRNINRPWSPGLFSAFQSPPGLGSILSSSGEQADQILTWPTPRTFLY